VIAFNKPYQSTAILHNMWSTVTSFMRIVAQTALGSKSTSTPSYPISGPTVDFLGVAKNILQEGKKWRNLILPTPKLRNQLFCKTFDGKMSNFKIQGRPGPLPTSMISHSPFNAWNVELVVSTWLRNCLRTKANICSIQNFLRRNTGYNIFQLIIDTVIKKSYCWT